MQIYYINLARRTDRRAFMEAQLEKLGLSATRIEAVTPDQLSEADRQRPLEPWTGAMLPETALCCCFSHRRALEAMLASSEAWVLILEDDAKLSASLPSFLAAFEAAPPVALVVRLEAATHAHLTLLPSDVERAGVRLHRFTGWAIGAAAYLISRPGARLVLASDEPKRRDMDVAMFHDVVPLSRRLRPLQANPALCIQAGNLPGSGSHVDSDLVKWRRPPKLSPWQRFARVLDRDVIQASRKAWFRFVLGGTRQKVPFKTD